MITHLLWFCILIDANFKKILYAYNLSMKKKVLSIFFVLVFVTIILFVVFNFFVYKRKYSNYVLQFSKEYNLDEALVYAVIKAESNFDTNAVSKSGALGLMQIIPNTAKWIAGELGEEYELHRMFEPETNIKYGCFYLNYLFEKFQDVDTVVCAYNAGEVAVLAWIENGELNQDKIDYKETKKYLSRVKGFYNIYKSSAISI